MEGWKDASKGSYSAESLTFCGLVVTACSDDEGPLTPCYYWDVTRNGKTVHDGWSGSYDQARADGVKGAFDLLTVDQARDAAIDWQHWSGEQHMDMAELAEWGHAFEALAERFPELRDEFVENAII